MHVYWPEILIIFKQGLLWNEEINPPTSKKVEFRCHNMCCGLYGLNRRRFRALPFTLNIFMAQTGHIENYHKIQIKNARNLEKYIGAKKRSRSFSVFECPALGNGYCFTTLNTFHLTMEKTQPFAQNCFQAQDVCWHIDKWSMCDDQIHAYQNEEGVCLWCSCTSN